MGWEAGDRGHKVTLLLVRTLLLSPHTPLLREGGRDKWWGETLMIRGGNEKRGGRRQVEGRRL